MANDNEIQAVPGAIATRIASVINWGRKNSLFPLPFGTACCAIEFMGDVSSRFDIARFGAEVVRFSPRQADMLLVLGTINYKMAWVLRRIYDQMPDPKWVVSVGACASSGGFYNNYTVLQGIDQVLPVDVYVPGCPPRPESILYAVLKLQEKIEHERLDERSKGKRVPLPVYAHGESPDPIGKTTQRVWAPEPGPDQIWQNEWKVSRARAKDAPVAGTPSAPVPEEPVKR
jgi:NADH-quinone oxidoreductase subunit B